MKKRTRPSSLARAVATIKKKVAALASVHKIPRLRRNPGEDAEREGLRRAMGRKNEIEALVDRGRMPGGGGVFTSNMIKALRMHPWSNTVDDWQRLFEAEYAIKYKRSKASRRLKNPSSGPVDTHAARELQLFIENDGDLYRQQMEPIQKNLVRKLLKGTYDHKQAPKLWLYLVDNGARKYNKEFGGGDGVGLFNLNTRKVVAEALAEEFLSNYRNGEYSYLIPEKQRTKSARRTNPRSRRARRGRR